MLFAKQSIKTSHNHGNFQTRNFQTRSKHVKWEINLFSYPPDFEISEARIVVSNIAH